jgi:hypothetical protein
LALIEQTELPEELTDSEIKFRDLLRDGKVQAGNHVADLQQLQAKQWLALSRFADLYCNEFESYDSLAFFPAFGRELKSRHAP